MNSKFCFGITLGLVFFAAVFALGVPSGVNATHCGALETWDPVNFSCETTGGTFCSNSGNDECTDLSTGTPFGFKYDRCEFIAGKFFCWRVAAADTTPPTSGVSANPSTTINVGDSVIIEATADDTFSGASGIREMGTRIDLNRDGDFVDTDVFGIIGLDEQRLCTFAASNADPTKDCNLTVSGAATTAAGAGPMNFEAWARDNHASNVITPGPVTGVLTINPAAGSNPPTSLLPPDSATVTTLTPLLQWIEPSSGTIADYAIVVEPPSGLFTVVAGRVPPGTTSWTVPAGNLVDGNSYRWRVGTCPVAGCLTGTIAWAPYQDFSVAVSSLTIAPITPTTATQGVSTAFGSIVSSTSAPINSCEFVVGGVSQGSMINAGTGQPFSSVPCPVSTNCTATFDWTPAAAGSFTVFARCNDGGAPIDGPPAIVMVSAAAGGPTGTVDINGGAGTTTSNSVNLTINCGACIVGTSEMEIANNAGFAPSSGPQPYATTFSPWITTPGTGTKTVHIRFRADSSSSWGAPSSDTIDVIAPGTFAITPDPLSCGSTPVGTAVTCSFTATNGTGATVNITNVTSSNPTEFTPVITSAPVPPAGTQLMSFTFQATAAGTYNETADFVTDTAGNFSLGINGTAAGSGTCDGGAPDGVKSPAEQCDPGPPPDLGGASCTTIPGGFTGGTLNCDTNCNFITSACTGGLPSSVTITFKNPISATSFTGLIGNIIDFIFTIAVIVAPIMLVIAGVIFMTAAGDPTKVATARRMLLWTIIGFGIIIVSKGLIEVLKGILGI